MPTTLSRVRVSITAMPTAGYLIYSGVMPLIKTYVAFNAYGLLVVA